ncbi:MucR family transcriptional regulator [Methylobacterium haplocladii]|uniref:Uncharacterized protein n=1 Tax=Methylobacterium haplocladii TaxID=1176176 RepID=A0A512IV26_9HYPH|nr:MucR family transcriptional regulator [Methylobacterium haplocladii]GEP01543.1 hypothetical protein MHA02_39300 [Methylobacterium haplocladii]GJD82273.1 hypothetical protein HPGCJGGD_0125 [Methylobacterium haplocladii]GLS59195.1 hypothetical protein GCM10007887_18610 [Methylobacterium haplocladii]
MSKDNNIRLATRIAQVYVANNALPASQVAALVRTLYAAISGLREDAAAASVEGGPTERPRETRK